MKLLWSLSSRRAVSLFLCVITLIYLTGCSYYSAKSLPLPSKMTYLEKVQNEKNMFLHRGDQVFEIRSITKINRDSLRILLAPLPAPISVPNYWYQEGLKSGRIKSNQASILREVHFFLKDSLAQSIEYGDLTLHTNQIADIKEIKSDRWPTTIASFVTLYAITHFTAKFLRDIFSSSCPFIYVYDGQQLAFQGEIFSGAVMSNLERNDYLPLPLLKPQQRELHLRIANELPEKQYVNQIELIAIPHAPGTEVIMDEQGNPQSITQPQLPVKALSAMGTDRKELISNPDQQAFQFDEMDVEKNSLNLTFPRPQQASQAKLVLSARNSMWFDQLFARFAEKMGAFYPTWMERLSAMPREERIQQQIDQDFPLSVFLKTDDGQWQLAHRFNLAGPLAWRDIVVPVDLSRVSGNTIEMRLETGFLFWEIDYVALDYSGNVNLKVIPIPLKKAKDQDGNSQVTALSADDSQYLTQPQPGLFTDLYFTAPKIPIGQEVDYFLHSKGYYEHIRNFQNLPNMAELEQFRQAHAFDQFSKAECLRLLNTTSAETQDNQ